MAMEINGNVYDYAGGCMNNTDNKKKTTEMYSRSDECSVTKETAQTGSTTKKTAADELSYLSKKYSNCSFVAANYSRGMRYGSNSTTNIAISPQFLSKMASDPELEAEYEGYIEDLQRLDKEFIAHEAARGWRVVAQGWAIDKDGGISGWVITTKDPNAKSHLQTMSENAEKIRKQNEAKKQEKAKLEEKRQEEQDEMEQFHEKYQEKLDEAGEKQFGDRWKGVAIINKEADNPDVSPKAANNNAGVTGVNMDIKA